MERLGHLARSLFLPPPIGEAVAQRRRRWTKSAATPRTTPKTIMLGALNVGIATCFEGWAWAEPDVHSETRNPATAVASLRIGSTPLGLST